MERFRIRIRLAGGVDVSMLLRSLQITLVLMVSCSLVTSSRAQGLAQKSPAPATGDAEPAVPPKKPLDLEVLIQNQPAYRVKAQDWGRVLQEAGYTPKFRPPKLGEEVRVEDVNDDGRITVHVVGGMAADGSIRIGDRSFTVGNLKAFTDLLDELATYGAGGPPTKNPKWGLTEDQLLEVTQLLLEPVAAEIVLETPVVTVESLGLPAGVRMTFTEAARETALSQRPDTAPETLDLNGFSKGTAIAILLAQYGLGFRPQRISAGHYNIEIDAGNESGNLWPAGWKARESTAAVLPAYLKSIPVDVEDAPVSAVLEVVADRLSIPVQTSSLALASKGLNLEVLTYTRKADRVSPARLLTAIGDKLDLGFDVRVDEGGKMFLWVTTKVESAAFRTRFAHIQQK